MKNIDLQSLVEQSRDIIGYTDGGYTEIKSLNVERFAALIVDHVADYTVKELLKSKITEEFFAAVAVGEGIKMHYGLRD